MLPARDPDEILKARGAANRPAARFEPYTTQIEHDGWDALCRGTGADFYGTLMTDDAVMVLVNGAVLDRDVRARDQLAGAFRQQDLAVRALDVGT